MLTFLELRLNASLLHQLTFLVMETTCMGITTPKGPVIFFFFFFSFVFLKRNHMFNVRCI